jgi:hypothetical protein
MKVGHFIIVLPALFGALALAGAVDGGRLGVALVGVMLIAAGIPLAYRMGRLKGRLPHESSSER